jgi:hypothetical protein
VLFDFSAPASLYLEEINRFIMMDGHHGHGDDLVVFQMPEQPISLSVTVWVEKSLSLLDRTALQEAVDTFIKSAFRENTSYKPTLTYPHSRFSFSKLSDELHTAIAGIHSLDYSRDDIVSGLWVARLSALTISVLVTE